MIYTSYFANIKNIPEEYDLFNIARSMPKGIKRTVNQLELAKPSWQLIDFYKSGKLTEEQYRIVYINQIELYLNDIVSSLSPNAILLCWETPCKLCHRHILAEVLNRQFNLNIEEFQI